MNRTLLTLTAGAALVAASTGCDRIGPVVSGVVEDVKKHTIEMAPTSTKIETMKAQLRDGEKLVSGARADAAFFEAEAAQREADHEVCMADIARLETEVRNGLELLDREQETYRVQGRDFSYGELGRIVNAKAGKLENLRSVEESLEREIGQLRDSASTLRTTASGKAEELEREKADLAMMEREAVSLERLDKVARRLELLTSNTRDVLSSSDYLDLKRSVGRENAAVRERLKGAGAETVGRTVPEIDLVSTAPEVDRAAERARIAERAGLRAAE